MKYSSLKSETVKVFEMPVCNKGVNLTDIPENVEDGYLTECKNVLFKDGKLQRRPGINAKGIIDADIFEFSQGYNYRLTDTTVFYENEYYKIATADVDYDDSSYFIFVYLIGNGGKVKNLGYMHFGRADSDIFYIPYKCVFYVGKAVAGGGIFALISLYNRENNIQTIEKIYEIGADFNSWFHNYNYYIPTAYINGRGNSYELAKKATTASTATPTILEPLNMLDGAFYSYFTSDGYSSTFKLPFTNLAKESVICRIYYSITGYIECIIYSDTTYADVTLQGISIRVNVDRQKGLINFTKGDGNFAIPQMSSYSENNIRILAKKEIEGGFKAIVSSDNCVMNGRKILLSSGNKIYSADFENPLYFPQSFNNDVGLPEEPITALISTDDKIYAFKENKVYLLKVTEGKNINKIALLSDNESVFYKEDTFEIKCIDNEVGCFQKEKIAVINGNTIWQSKTGDIFLCSSDKVENVSQNIKPFFENVSEAQLQSAVCGSILGYYFLCVGNKAIIMDCESENDYSSWYILEFPPQIRIIGIDPNNNLFLCVNECNVCFTAQFDGNTDNIIVGNLNKKEVASIEIEATLKTKSFNFGNISKRKKISRIYLQLDANDCVSIRVGNDEVFADFEITNADFMYRKRKYVKLITNLKGLKDIYIQLKTKGNMALGKGEFYFKQI